MEISKIRLNSPIPATTTSAGRLLPSDNKTSETRPSLPLKASTVTLNLNFTLFDSKS